MNHIIKGFKGLCPTVSLPGQGQSPKIINNLYKIHQKGKKYNYLLYLQCIIIGI